MLDALDRRGGGRAALGDDAHHRLAQQLTSWSGGRLIDLRALRRATLDHRRGFAAVGRQGAVEPRHVDHGLRVVALADRQVQLVRAGRPVPRAVLLVEVLRNARSERAGRFSSGRSIPAFVEAERDRPGDEPGQRRSFGRADRSTRRTTARSRLARSRLPWPFFFQHLPGAVPKVVMPAARLRHVRSNVIRLSSSAITDVASLNVEPGRLLALERLVVERLARIVAQRIVVGASTRRRRTGSDRSPASCRAPAPRRSAESSPPPRRPSESPNSR